MVDSSSTNIESDSAVTNPLNIFTALKDVINKNQPNAATVAMLNHPEVSNLLAQFKKYGEEFVRFIDQLHIQTVIFEPAADSNADVTIKIMSSTDEITTDTKTASTDPKKNNVSSVKGKVAAVYDTMMRINGDVQNTYPSKIDPTLWGRHNALVDQMWKSKIDTMIKIIDGITDALKIGRLF
jgi:hypothetical protein